MNKDGFKERDKQNRKLDPSVDRPGVSTKMWNLTTFYNQWVEDERILAGFPWLFFDSQEGCVCVCMHCAHVPGLWLLWLASTLIYNPVGREKNLAVTSTISEKLALIQMICLINCIPNILSLVEKEDFPCKRNANHFTFFASFAISYKPTGKTEVTFMKINYFPLSCEAIKPYGRIYLHT